MASLVNAHGGYFRLPESAQSGGVVYCRRTAGSYEVYAMPARGDELWSSPALPGFDPERDLAALHDEPAFLWRNGGSLLKIDILSGKVLARFRAAPDEPVASLKILAVGVEGAARDHVAVSGWGVIRLLAPDLSVVLTVRSDSDAAEFRGAALHVDKGTFTVST